jgi:NADPH2:quinone reductase
MGSDMAQMKAIRVEEFGEVDVLWYVDVGRPEPGEGEVLIEVRSAGVNYADTMRRRNQYVEPQNLPFTPGSEVAGTVAEVGEEVDDVSVGDAWSACSGRAATPSTPSRRRGA